MAKVVGKVLDVSLRRYVKDGQEKRVADIVVKSGSDLIKATMFDGDVTKGNHMQYEQIVGKDAVVDVSPDVFRGNLQWRLGFEDPKVIKDQHSASAAGKAA